MCKVDTSLVWPRLTKKILLEEKIRVWYGGCESKNVHGVSKMRLIGGDNNSRRNVLAKSGLSTIPSILPE